VTALQSRITCGQPCATALPHSAKQREQNSNPLWPQNRETRDSKPEAREMTLSSPADATSAPSEEMATPWIPRACSLPYRGTDTLCEIR